MKSFYRSLILDPSTWVLLISNFFVIFWVFSQGLHFMTVLWIYWIQSVIIGISNFFRILTLKKFSTKNFKLNNLPAKPTRATKISVAFFFLLHYNIFHLVYAGFLFGYSIGNFSGLNLSLIFYSAIIFFLNHLFSFFYNKKKDEQKKCNISAIMFFPYARIIPMHLIILFGAFLGSSSLFIFVLLKTVADIIMHSIEHAEKRGKL